MATTAPPHRMPLPPKPRGELVLQLVLIALAMFFTSLAVNNLLHGIGFVAPLLWFALVALMVAANVQQAGGWRLFLVNRVGDFVNRRFVQVDPADAHARCLRFGFTLFGRHFVERSIALDRVESLDWSAGQGSSMTGRDCNDWQVWLWFDHGDPARAEAERPWSRKPGRDLYGVGPDGPRDRTEALARSFAVFLGTVGVDLVPGTAPNSLVRRVE